MIALNRNYIQLEGSKAPALAYEHWFRQFEKPHTKPEQVVVLSRVLPASVNTGYANLHNFVVHELNGKPVRSLKHLLEMIEEMPQHTSYLVFESEWDPLPVVLDYQQSLREHERILRLYGIYEDRRFHAEKEPAG